MHPIKLHDHDNRVVHNIKVFKLLVRIIFCIAARHLNMVAGIMIYFLLTEMLVTSIANKTIVHVNSSQMLEELMQNISEGSGKNDIDIVLELDSSQDYKLSEGTFTSFTNMTITIKSNNEYQSVNVYCSNRFHPSRGLGFANSVVSIIQVNFISCGAHLRLLPRTFIDDFNSSSELHYSSAHSAALIMVSCTVYMNNVTMVSSYGFAIIGHNLIISNFSFLHINHPNVSKTTHHYHSLPGIGSGLLLYYRDIQSSNTSKIITVSLLNTTIENNIENSRRLYYGYNCYQIADHHFMNQPLNNAAGLTILYTQQTSHKIYTIIDGLTLLNNTGTYAGGMLVIMFEGMSSFTHITNSVFKNNFIQYCFGGDIQYYLLRGRISSISNQLIVDNTLFYGGKSQIKHTRLLGAVYIYIYHQATITFRKLHFAKHSSPDVDGTCIAIRNHGIVNVVNVTMSGITAVNNTNKYKITKSMFYFENIHNVTFLGVNEFKHNEGSVIHGVNSNIVLYERILFKGNDAENGAAIRLEGNGQLYFMEGLNASFIDNRAYFSGGAIYITSHSYRACGVQIKNKQRTHVNFINNIGNTAGNTLFVEPVYNCENHGIYRKDWFRRFMVYFSLDKQQNVTNSLLPLSTFPIDLSIDIIEDTHIVYNHHSHYDMFQLQKFPGETIFLNIQARDQYHRHVFSFINTQILCNSRHCLRSKLWLHKSGGNIALEGQAKNLMNISIHTTCLKWVTLTLVLSAPRIYSKTVTIKLLPCPLGFSLDESSGTCKCSNVLKKISNIKCWIDERLIKLDSNNRDVWIGVIKNTSATSTVCPLNYCNTDPRYRMIKSTDNGIMLTNDTTHTIPYCLGNREGILCGKCIGNYSVVLWSSECKQCSNLSFLTIIGYGITGPVLIYMMFALQLTLTTGTVNGIIFYAQVASAGLLLPQSHTTYQTISNNYRVGRSFLSFLRLNQLFPICLYNGMNQLWKTGLTLVLPGYLLIIVVVIIIISRYSTWLSNRTSHSSIQVLVTVVHLCFSNLLVQLIHVFTPATVYTTNGTSLVWYLDGSVPYRGHSHNILALISTMTVGIVIIPYILLLILGRPLIKCSKIANLYIRPIYEAIHAPYKEGRQYWFTARLVLLIIMYLLYSLLKANNSSELNTAISTLLFSFTVIQAISRPFKSNAINVLDTWLMLNISLVYNTLSNKISSESINFIMTTVILAILTLVLIIAYHVYLVTIHNRKFQEVIDKLENIKLFRMITSRSITRSRVTRELTTDSYYGPCTQYREPLITDIEYDST